MLKTGVVKNGMVEFEGNTHTIAKAAAIVDQLIGETYEVKEEIKSTELYKWDTNANVWLTLSSWKWIFENCHTVSVGKGKKQWMYVHKGDAKEVLTGIITAYNNGEVRISEFEAEGSKYEVYQASDDNKFNQFDLVIKDGQKFEKTIKFYEKMLARLSQ